MQKIDIVRVKLDTEKSIYSDENIDSPEKMIRVVGDEISDLAHECVFLANLNTKNQIINMSVISQGTINQSILHPREIFNKAILSNATSIMLFHNHPSGDITPSKQDKDITEKIGFSGELLGIKLLDHVIVGAGNSEYFSFAREDLLPSILTKENTRNFLKSLDEIQDDVLPKKTDFKNEIEKLKYYNYEAYIKDFLTEKTGEESPYVLNNLYLKYEEENRLINPDIIKDIDSFKKEEKNIIEDINNVFKNTLFIDIRDVLDEITSLENNRTKDISIEFYTDTAGHDVFIELNDVSDLNDFYDKLLEYIDNWDIEQELQIWTEMVGKNGVPDIRTLVEDHKEIERKFDDLQYELRTNVEIRDNIDNFKRSLYEESIEGEIEF
ncbi:JAB domain-containing protein [Anaerovoracaceae bacterium SGI.195]